MGKVKKTRRKFTSKFKSQVVIEALKERISMSELATKYEVHPNQNTTWKREFLDNADLAFGGDAESSSEISTLQQQKEELFKKVGELQMDNDFLKKSLKKAGL